MNPTAVLSLIANSMLCLFNLTLHKEQLLSYLQRKFQVFVLGPRALFVPGCVDSMTYITVVGFKTPLYMYGYIHPINLHTGLLALE